MDEIDSIIINSLRQIGCEIAEDFNSLDEFSPELLVSSVSKCLHLIDPSLDLPKVLPAAMAQKFSATATIAEACTSVGFRGDIGYQTFLYSNVIEVRRVFMYLIEILPKDEPDQVAAPSQPRTRKAEIEADIRRNLMMALKAPWKRSIVEFIEPSELAFETVPLKISSSDGAKDLPSVFQQTNANNLFPSIIVRNDQDLFGSEDIMRRTLDRKKPKPQPRLLEGKQESFEDNSPISEDQSLCKTDEDPIEIDPLELVRMRIEQLKDEIRAKLVLKQELELKSNELNKSFQEEEDKLDKLNREKRVKEKTQMVLDNPEENVQKLEQLIENSHEKMKKLQDQWKEHSLPLLDALEKIKERNSHKLSKSKMIEDQIQDIRKKQTEVREQHANNFTVYNQLTAELEALNQNISRSSYTSRILEIINNIRKQKMDIDKILCDTREVQKDINTIGGQLDRQFTVTDDLLFKNAKRDEYLRKSYKHLANLHKDCSELVKYIQESGGIVRETRDIEEQIETEKMRNVSANLERVSADLEQMQNENSQLREKIIRLSQQ